LLGFGGDYVAPDGSSCVHRGVDVAAGAGTSFEAPVAGTVRFAGRVPGPHGGSILAVTLDTAQGTVSLLPFERLTVSKGEEIAAGEAVGSVADSGDPSSVEPHIHMGLRHGDLYVDPSALLAPASPTNQPQTAPQTDPVPQPVTQPSENTAPAPTPSPQVAPAALPVLAEGVSLAPAATTIPAEQLAEAPAPIIATRRVGSAAALEADPEASVLSPRIAATTNSGAQVPGGVGTLRQVASGGAVRTALGELSAAAAPVTGALAILIAAVTYVLGRRAFDRRLTADSPVSDRLGRLLQQLRAGDTLRGLTSCSGHAAFTVPGPFSPEEVTK